MARGRIAAGALSAALAFATNAQADGPDHDLWALALNIYHEAGEGRQAMLAVGWLTLNRLRHPDFPKSLYEVVYDANGAGCAFSWTCDGREDLPRDFRRFALALAIAKELLSPAPPPDPTRGALFMHARSRKPPTYTKHLRRSAVIGQNVFYRRS
ncbi:MAG: cell wall hydrolase [Geminicoccaceae bacterium]|nr:cell wall hydrolase [Geminicoccaceae bacterium]